MPSSRVIVSIPDPLSCRKTSLSSDPLTRAALCILRNPGLASINRISVIVL